MSQAISRQAITKEARIRTLPGPRGICDRQATNGAQVFSDYFGLALSVSFHQCFIPNPSSNNDDA